MSVARGFGLNGKSIYTNVAKPIVVYLNFIVDHTNGNGLGVRSVKSNGYVESVFMNTTQTPGIVNGVTNPNPVAGYALITFKNNFNYYLGGFSGQVVPTTSNSTTSLTAGHAYVITSVGTSTLANWQTAGLPQGFIPTVGQSFISLITGSITGSGTVGLAGIPTTQVVTVIGDPNQQINNSNIAVNAGSKILIQFAAATNSSTTTLVAAAPADNSVVGMTFNFDGSDVTIDGI
jgi:hypothetical protein